MENDEKNGNVPTSVPTFDWIAMGQKRYSEPKLYIPKKNGRATVAPGNRWYVYFYWRTDPNGPLNKKFTFTKKINRLKTVAERKLAGERMVMAYRNALERDWDPVRKSAKPETSHKRGQMMTVEKALKYAFEIKSRSKKGPTITGYEFHMGRFLEWAKQNGYLGMDIKKFSIDHFYEFMDWLRFEYLKENQEPLSGSSVNNHKRSISAMFSTLKNERVISANFIKDIPPVDSEPVNNKAFTPDELIRIKKHLQKEDPYLIHFISFMMYPLLRPREICRLKVRDINTKNWFLSVETKTDVLSYRRIIGKMKPTIEALDLEGQPGSFELFSNIDRPKDWSDAQLKSRVDHFGVRFRKVKDELGFGREYGLYSFRHTAIMDLYNSLLQEGMGEQEILFKLMPITQHKSVAGLKNYLRNMKMVMPADHSAIYTIDF